MAGGSLTITVDNPRMLSAVAQRVLCAVLVANRPHVRTTTGANGRQALVLDEADFPAGPTLRLNPGGANLLAGYVAGTKIVANVANAGAVGIGPTTPLTAACGGDDTHRVVITAVATSVGANPKAVTINYTNFATNGTVNVEWGDGTQTLGAAEANAALAHTYPEVGTWTIRIRDASAPSDDTDAVFAIQIP